jgi:hypothetical protein
MTHESERTYGEGKEHLRAPFACPRQDVDRPTSTGINLYFHQSYYIKERAVKRVNNWKIEGNFFFHAVECYVQ